MEDFSVSLLEMIGPISIGAGLIVIVKYGDETYESLLWISSDQERLKDKLIMPSKFLEKEKIDRIQEHPQYEEMLKIALNSIPSKEVILKEANL